MRFHIVGGFGAIGTLVTYYLRHALPRTNAITVLHKEPGIARASRRGDGRAIIETNGVVRWEKDISHDQIQSYSDSGREEYVARRLEAAAALGEEQPLFQEEEPVHTIESLILAIKANVAISIIKQLVPRLTADSTIVLLHNGMGVYEDLLKNVFRNPEHRPHIVVSSNTHGAWSKRRGYSVHSGVGSIHLGITPDGHGRDFEASVRSTLPKALQRTNLDDITSGPDDPAHARYASLRNTIEAFTMAEGLHASWRPVHDVQMAMRRKLVVNSVVNPLTALLNCKNADIFTVPGGERLCEALCKEASHVFHAQWKEEMKDEVSVTGNSMFPRELTTSALVQECKRVVEITGSNMSSMLVDVRRSRNTELDYLNGYIMRLAQQYKVPVHGMAAIINLMQLRCAIPLDNIHPFHEVL
ncbi:predicted protein [Sparassis crispa]|uniref:2-dehydropantoate 2-reductase n=1 Tax=Sparassis crispa TaxID=139825 RepID=A0A401G6H3_9APHY|nr:predicted protein [Sparassis crispa]GBE77765.1 predicted protein [Sparassis crispa]